MLLPATLSLILPDHLVQVHVLQSVILEFGMGRHCLVSNICPLPALLHSLKGDGEESLGEGLLLLGQVGVDNGFFLGWDGEINVALQTTQKERSQNLQRATGQGRDRKDCTSTVTKKTN